LYSSLNNFFGGRGEIKVMEVSEKCGVHDEVRKRKRSSGKNNRLLSFFDTTQTA
jgi:hypothetical protein